MTMFGTGGPGPGVFMYNWVYLYSRLRTGLAVYRHLVRINYYYCAVWVNIKLTEN